MTSVKVLKPEGNQFLGRRRSSQIDHINRIRDANAKRQFVSIYADLEEGDKLKSDKNTVMPSSVSSVKEETFHEDCLPYRSVESFGSASTEDKKDVSQISSEIKMSKNVKGTRSLEKHEISSRKESMSRSVESSGSASIEDKNDVSRTSSKIKMSKNIKGTQSPEKLETSSRKKSMSRSVERLGSANTEGKKDVPRPSSGRKMSKKVKGRRGSENLKISSRKKSTSQEPAAEKQGLKKSKLKKVHAHKDVSRELLAKPTEVPKKRSSRNDKDEANLKPTSLRNKAEQISKAVKRDQNCEKKLDEKEYLENHTLDSDQDSENPANDMVEDVEDFEKMKNTQKGVKEDQTLTKKLNGKEYPENHGDLDSDQDSNNSAYDMLANAANLKKPVTAKDIIVLKWLHKMRCPEACALDASEESSDYEGNQKYPIEIIKSPSAINANEESHDDISQKSSKSRSFEFHPSIEHVSVEGISQRGIFPDDVSFETGGSKEYQHAESRDSSRVVEMRVTELGRLHIVLNLKSLSPEDSAVVVWLDDLPKSDRKPDFRRRLSISSLENMQQRPSILKSHSSQALENEASPKPKIYFPTVTVLKNLAVDSKGRLRDLKVDPSDSVFYKRCNLSHSEELFNKI